MESTASDNVMKTTEMTTKDLENYLNLVDKAVVGSERNDSNFERSSVGKMLSNNTPCTEKLFMKGRVIQCGKCLIFRNCHNHPYLQ